MYIERLGTLLVGARQATKKSQKKMALTMGVSLSTIKIWETQRILPSLERIPDIVQYYKIEESIFKQAFLLAKKERLEQIQSLRNIRRKNRKNTVDELFDGDIERRHIFHLLNPKLACYD